ncbi:mor transcription activator domain protein [Clostridium sp. CAG:964]|nr:mor transcription activator domain protein [Clostridium sp. CAG:964]
MDNIKIQDLQGEQRQIAETIGLEAYLKLVKIYGGTNIYIAKIDKLLSIKRDEEIVKRFNGYNFKSLANQYRLSERAVREIINRENSRILNQQLSFFDDS